MSDAKTQSNRNASSETTPLLRVRDLTTSFRVEGNTARAVNGVSFDIQPDEVLGIVGE